MIEIGTFGGSFSFPNAINQRGEVVGVALDAVPDDFSMLGLGTRTHAFLRRNGNLLGSLGHGKTHLGRLRNLVFSGGSFSGLNAVTQEAAGSNPVAPARIVRDICQ